ncbi:hypothetical protein OIO90_003918 [Microbotryomycetes sp. JL221]|nr:hypothetical protein OIO90_003918 [Microbotryomycetes sp. JL221]
MTTPTPHVGQRICLYTNHDSSGAHDDHKYLGTVRYIGAVPPTKGDWLGVEWDLKQGTSKGKHSGTYDKTGIEYFQCKVSGTGSFLRPQALEPNFAGQSFWSAVENRYANADSALTTSGLDKDASFKLEVTDLTSIGQRFSKLESLREIGLEWQGVNGAGTESDRRFVRQRLTAVKKLNLSYSQVASVEELARIVQDLPRLDTLNFKFVLQSTRADRATARNVCISQAGQIDPESNVDGLDHSLPNLVQLEFGDNLVASLNSHSPLHLPKLQSLNLEGNDISDWRQIACVGQSLPSLATLLVARCKVVDIPAPADAATKLPSLHHLSLSQTKIASWSSINHLALTVPQLDSLSLDGVALANNLPERYFRLGVIARIGSIKMLDNSPVSDTEREDAELWYLSMVDKESGTDFDKQENHPRWKELAQKYDRSPANDAPSAKKVSDRFIQLNIVEDNTLTTVKVRTLPESRTLLLRTLIGKALSKPLPKTKYKLVALLQPSAEGETEPLEVEIDPKDEGKEVGWWGLTDGDAIRVPMSGGFSLARTPSLDSTLHIVAQHSPKQPAASFQSPPSRRKARPSTADSNSTTTSSIAQRVVGGVQTDSSSLSSATSYSSAQERLKMPGSDYLTPYAVAILEQQQLQSRSVNPSTASAERAPESGLPKPAKTGNKLLAKLGLSSKSKKTKNNSSSSRVWLDDPIAAYQAQQRAMTNSIGNKAVSAQQQIKNAAIHVREQGIKAVKLVKKKLSSKTPKEELPKTWEEYQTRYVNNEMDLEDPPIPPALTEDGKPTPLESRCFMPPMPANEAARQNVVNRLDLFGTKAAAESTTTLQLGATRQNDDNTSVTPSTARSHVSNVEEAVCSMKDHPAFRDIVSKCKDMFDSKVSMLTVLDDEQQLFLVTGGMDLGSGLPRSVTFCAHAIMDDDNNGMVVLDAKDDWRFANSVPATQLGARFYAGVPLLAPSFGDPEAPPIPIGTLCVADDRPREGFTDEQRQYLHDMAAKASAEVEKWVNDRMMGKLSRLEESFQASAISLPAEAERLRPEPLEDEPARSVTPVSISAASLPIPPQRSERRPKTPIQAPSPAPMGELPPPPSAVSSPVVRSPYNEHMRSGSDAISDATSSSVSRRNSVDAVSISSATTALTAPSIASNTNRSIKTYTRSANSSTGLSLAVTSEAPVSAIPRDLQKIFDQAVRMLAKALDLSLVYLVSLDMSQQHITGSPILKVLASHGMPTPAPSFDPALHLKALRAPEGGLLYKNPKFESTPNATLSNSPAFAQGMLIPILEVRRTGYVLSGYTKQVERQFEQKDLSMMIKFAEQLEAFCTKVGKGSNNIVA